MSDINATLAERGARYGSFQEHAQIVDDFCSCVPIEAFHRMKPDAKQAMRVIFDKFARMLNGDAEYDDNWRDIVGYATLVLNRMERDAETKSDRPSPSDTNIPTTR